MVYINNICQAHMDLQENQQIELHYKSGRITLIKQQDQIRKLNGDLEVKREYMGNWICTIIVDCAEVEYMIIKQREL